MVWSASIHRRFVVAYLEISGELCLNLDLLRTKLNYCSKRAIDALDGELMLRVKIFCTIGPASREIDMLTKIAEAGMNVARLNMSHGTHEYHNGTIERVRTVSERLNKPIAIMADLAGSQTARGHDAGGRRSLVEGEEAYAHHRRYRWRARPRAGSVRRFASAVKPGDRILIDDGMLELEVDRDLEQRNRHPRDHWRVLHDKKGVNLPDGSPNIPCADRKRPRRRPLSRWPTKWTGSPLSFVRTATEVLELKAMIEEYSTFGRTTPVIAKIEKPEAITNIDAIIQAPTASWWRGATWASKPARKSCRRYRR